MSAAALDALALRLSTAYALAKEAGHSDVDAWRNVALVVQRDAERVGEPWKGDPSGSMYADRPAVKP